MMKAGDSIGRVYALSSFSSGQVDKVCISAKVTECTRAAGSRPAHVPTLVLVPCTLYQQSESDERTLLVSHAAPPYQLRAYCQLADTWVLIGDC